LSSITESKLEVESLSLPEKLCEGNAELLITIVAGGKTLSVYYHTSENTNTTLQSMPLKQQVSHRVMNLLNGYLSLFQ
jgi:hypothetical protein